MDEKLDIVIKMLGEILERLPEKRSASVEEKWDEIPNADLEKTGFKVSRSMTNPTVSGKRPMSVWAVKGFPKFKGIHSKLKEISGAKWFRGEWRFFYDPSNKLLELAAVISLEKGN